MSLAPVRRRVCRGRSVPRFQKEQTGDSKPHHQSSGCLATIVGPRNCDMRRAVVCEAETVRKPKARVRYQSAIRPVFCGSCICVRLFILLEHSKAADRIYNHSPMTVTVRSFAKINLGLRIGAPRADGYHELRTVYQTIGLHDVIRVRPTTGSRIEVRCADPRVPSDESNTCYRLVARALAVLKARRGFVIEIEKRLPVKGGLGGASSNAVAA